MHFACFVSGYWVAGFVVVRTRIFVIFLYASYRNYAHSDSFFFKLNEHTHNHKAGKEKIDGCYSVVGGLTHQISR